MKYGFGYETLEERVYILEMLKAAMLTSEERKTANESIDSYMEWENVLFSSKSEIILCRYVEISAVLWYIYYHVNVLCNLQKSTLI